MVSEIGGMFRAVKKLAIWAVIWCVGFVWQRVNEGVRTIIKSMMS